jgi:predicted lipoprotein with Yx(FWY)xxD motif
MRRIAKYLLPALAASLTLAACGNSSKSQGSSSQASAPATTTASASQPSGGVVRSASNSTLGTTVLTEAKGMTLYSLSGEHGGKFICTSSACLGVWHPVKAEGASAPSGSVGSLGTVKRPDGSEQITYKSMPLYTFASDQQPGDAKGEGIKDVGTWNAVTTGAATTAAKATPATASEPAGASEAAPESESSSSSSGSSGGYAY